jgi:hypothetical protein
LYPKVAENEIETARKKDTFPTIRYTVVLVWHFSPSAFAFFYSVANKPTMLTLSLSIHNKQIFLVDC